jgi:alpha-L-fucosidase
MVSIHTESPVGSIHYTVDGSEPRPGSPVYKEGFLLSRGGLVKARSFEADGSSSEVTVSEWGLSKKDWKVLAPAGSDKASLAIDERAGTVYSSLGGSGGGQFPREIAIDMGEEELIDAWTYLPRQDKKTGGIVDRYEFYTSADGKDWQKAAEGEFANIRSNPLEQVVRLDHPVQARYFKFAAVHVTDGEGMTIAELGVRGKSL